MEYSINLALAEIQQKLKAPKGQFNSFGKYKYRSCEDILEAVKPLLKEKKLFLTMHDEVELIGERYYIKATVTLCDEKNSFISATAYAREDDVKKGMDGSQITGAASSYARKYALSGLFAIDDTKDSDSMSDPDIVMSKAVATKKEDPELKAVKEQFAATMKNHNLNGIVICKQFGIGRSPSADELMTALEAISKRIEAKDIPEDWRMK